MSFSPLLYRSRRRDRNRWSDHTPIPTIGAASGGDRNSMPLLSACQITRATAIGAAAGPSEHSWHPVMTVDTTNPSYWLNWRFFVCALWVLSSMIVASILIWKYEGPSSEGREGAEFQQEGSGTLYADESWRPCLKEIHPAWLLTYRITAFFILLALLVIKIVVGGGGVFYFYTQWTFALVTIYFGLGSLLSVYGCHQYINKIGSDKADCMKLDAERGTYVPPRNEEDTDEQVTMKNYNFREECNIRETAGTLGYVFQIIYQTNAGAVVLTDCVFWFVIFPFLAIKDYDTNLLMVGMHSVNVAFLLGDTALNCLRFPWFRISYYLLWTAAYVIFQWIIHACISIWWPYPFLDLSFPRAPIWYLVVTLMHIPCYAVFPLFIKLKHSLLSTWFPQSYRCGQ